MCYKITVSPDCRLQRHTQANFKEMISSEAQPMSGEYQQFGALVTGKIVAEQTDTQRTNHIALLDIGVSVSMFRDSSEPVEGRHSSASNNIVKLEAGSSYSECLATGTVAIGKIQVKDSTHVHDLNGKLLWVGHISDQNIIVVFTKD